MFESLKKSVLYTAKYSVSYIIHPNLYIYIYVCTYPIYIYTSHLHKMLVSSAFMAASVECAMSLHSQWKVGRRLAGGFLSLGIHIMVANYALRL